MRLDSDFPVPVKWAFRGGDADDRLSCADGMLTLQDIGRAARISPKEARRQIEAYYGQTIPEGGAVFSLNPETVPPPETTTRAEMARIVAERLSLGCFRARKRAAEVRATTPPKPERKRMTSKSHPWKEGRGGRSIRAAEGGAHVATLRCGCGETREFRFRALAGADQIDNKFKQAGWRIDPAKCPTCVHPQKEPAVTATPSNAAIRSQAAMFRLLTDHFDVDAGRYADGWSDERVAKETGAAPAMVSGVREEAFGPLKEPEEIAALARDIATFDGMLVEAAGTVETLKSELGGMKTRLADLRKKFAA